MVSIFLASRQVVVEMECLDGELSNLVIRANLIRRWIRGPKLLSDKQGPYDLRILSLKIEACLDVHESA